MNGTGLLFEVEDLLLASAARSVPTPKVGEQLFKDTFRRRMEPQLVLTDGKSSGVRGPRAAMYRRSS